MFSLLGEEKGLCLCADSLSAFKYITEHKEAALKDMKKYDDMIASAGTKEQKRFLENERDSFMFFLEAGYGVLILRRLMETMESSEQSPLIIARLYEEEKALFYGQIQLTSLSVGAMCGIIKMLVDNGKITLNDKAVIPLSAEGYDFIDDGFDYVCSAETSEMLAKFEKTAKERIEDTISSIKGLFEGVELTPEQALYIDFELKGLLIFLKENFRGIAYQALLTSEIPAELIEADKILINNSLERLPAVLGIIERLVARGIITIQNEGSM